MRSSRTTLLIPTFGLSLLAPLLPAYAQNDARTSSDSTELLLAGRNTLVTTATKSKLSLAESPAAVTVITEEDIKLSGARNITDLFKSIAGVSVIESNRSLQGVGIRGYNEEFANKLLVMIDGRTIYQTFFGNVFWNQEPLLLAQIKQIEIVRGPGSALYGANAFSGVINIITKRPEDLVRQADKFQFVLSYGEQDSAFAEALLTLGKPKDWAVTLGAGFHSTSGIAESSQNPIEEGHKTPIFYIGLQKQIYKSKLNIDHFRADIEYDLATSYRLPQSQGQQLSTIINYQEERPNPLSARVYITGANLEQNDTSLVETDTIDVEIQKQQRLTNNHSIIFGAAYRNLKFISPIAGDTLHTQTFATTYLQSQLKVCRNTTLFLGGRYDHNSLYGDYLSPRVSAVHRLDSSQTLRLSYGTAFRAPTLVDSYVQTTFESSIPGLPPTTVRGNQSLSPERISSLEAGYRKETPKYVISTAVYYNQSANLLNWIPTAFLPSPPFPQNVPAAIQRGNSGGSTSYGLEIEGELKLSKQSSFFANYSYLAVEHGSGLDQYYSPNHIVNFGIKGRWNSRMSGTVVCRVVGGEKVPSPQGQIVIPAYGVVDANLNYRLQSRGNLDLTLTATNLFNTRYFAYRLNVSEANDTTSVRQRRTLWLGLRGRF